MSKRKVHEIVSESGVVKVFRDTDWDTWEIVGYAPWLGMKRVTSCEESSLAFAKDVAAVIATELACDHARYLQDSRSTELAAMSEAELVDSIAKLRAIHMNACADELQAELDARKAADVELPTEADLEYYDAQAEAMGVPKREPAHSEQDEAFEIVHGYGVPIKSNLTSFATGKPVPKVRMVRVTLFNNGTDFPGPWEVFDASKFGHQCATLAALGMPFSVEYEDRPV